MTAPVPAPLVSALADRYRIERELGAGGMATVYLAHDLRHQRKVALKVLRPDLSATMGPERFIREVTIAANLSHPHILPLYDSGEAAGFLYYVMPFIEGQTLRDRLQRERELPVGDAVRILRDVTDAMATAHAKGVVHRDLKPENIMLSGRHALVADFGVAKAVSEATGRNTLTTAGVALGTPTYMAPEQATADPLTDHRADLYALGVIAYEVLTGEPPFARGTPQAILAAHVTEAPRAVTERRASIPAPLAAVVMRCLEKKPADRPRDAEEMLAVLETVMTSSGGITPTDTRPVPAVTPPITRHRWVRSAAIVVGVAVVAGGVWFAATSRNAPVNSRVRSPVVVVPFEVRATDPALKSIGVDAAARIAGALQQAGFGEVVPYQDEAGEVAFSEATVRRIARASKAATLVFGTVTQRGEDVEFEARVVRAGDQRTVWSLGPVRSAAAAPDSSLEPLTQRVLGALGFYLTTLTEGYLDPGGRKPPASVEAVRMAVRSEELYRRRRYAESRVATDAAIRADSLWPWIHIRLAFVHFNLANWSARDSVLGRLERQRPMLMPGDALALDHLLASRGSPEEEMRGTLAAYAADSVQYGFYALWSAVRARRPREALRYFASRDTSLRSSLDWEPWYRRAAMAHHMLGDFAGELRVAREARRRQPQELTHWMSEVRALCGQGQFGAVDSLIVASRTNESPTAARSLLFVATAESERHGFGAQARRYAEQALGMLRTGTDSAASDRDAQRVAAQSFRVLGNYRAAISALAPATPSTGLPALVAELERARYRLLLGDSAGIRSLVKTVQTARFQDSDLSQLEQPQSQMPAHLAAQVLALLGQKDESLSMLRQALNQGVRLNIDEPLYWYWAPIKDYPPFVELVKIR